MEANGTGRCVGLDPNISVFRVPSRKLYGRYTLVQGRSPQDVPKAVSFLGGNPDFVFIDAMHLYACVLDDLTAIAPYVANGAHILLHDTYHLGIDAAVSTFVLDHPDLVDLGIITTHPVGDGKILGQGLRLLRVGPVNSGKHLSDAYGALMPSDPSALWNYDEFAVRAGLVRERNGRYERIQ
jgi:hypothetical protein